MIYDRYYHSRLSNAEKEIYKTIYAGLQNFEKEIAIRRISQYTLTGIVTAINYDNPHLFYVCLNEFTVRQIGARFYYIPKYYFTEKESAALQRGLLRQITAIAKKIGGGDCDKIYALHDILAKNLTYDEKAKSDISRAPYAYTILGALLRKSAVCEGIAKAVKLLLNVLDIKCIVATGKIDDEPGEAHAWNIAQIDGKPVHLDVTNDLANADDKIARHIFCNLSDRTIRLSCSWECEYPHCSYDGYDYFVKNNLLVVGKDDLKRILSLALSERRNFAEFRLVSPISCDSLVRAATQIVLKLTRRRSVDMFVSFNERQRAVLLKW